MRPDQVLEARGQIDAIANYIDHALEELTLSHTPSTTALIQSCFTIPNQHLPNGPTTDGKNVLIDDVLRLTRF